MAGIKISALPVVASALLTDIYPVVQAGVTSQESLQQVLTLFNTNIAVTNSNFSGTLAPNHGGSGVANTGTFTVGGNTAFSGAFTFTGTLTGNTAVTFPTSGTLATTASIPALPLSLANGGTNAALTANNGGIFYSTATAGAILAGTATAGQALLSGASTTPVWSTPTYPSASGTNRKILVSDGTNNVYSTETWAVPGTSGNFLKSDGTNWTSAAGPVGVSVTTKGDLQGYDSAANRVPVSTQNGYSLYSDSTQTLGLGWQVPHQTPAYSMEREIDFFGNSSANDYASQQNNSGTGSTVGFQSNITTDGKHFGQAQIAMGTTNSGRSGIVYPSPATFQLSGGQLILECDIYLTALSNGTDTYTAWFGIKNGAGTNTPGSGDHAAWIAYTDGTNSGRWTCNTANNTGSVTTTNSSTAVSAVTWTRLKVVVDATDANVNYFVNDVNVGTVSGTLPLATNGYACIFGMQKTAGTTDAPAYIDYIYFRKEFTTAR